MTDTPADQAEGEMVADRSGTGSQHAASAAREPRRSAALTPQIRDRIAIQLRSMYESVATQPVPDRFADLIARLDSNDRDQG